MHAYSEVSSFFSSHSFSFISVSTRAGTIHPLTIQFDSLRSRFDLIRFDSNKYVIVVKRYSINQFVPNP